MLLISTLRSLSFLFFIQIDSESKINFFSHRHFPLNFLSFSQHVAHVYSNNRFYPNLTSNDSYFDWECRVKMHVFLLNAPRFSQNSNTIAHFSLLYSLFLSLTSSLMYTNHEKENVRFLSYSLTNEIFYSLKKPPENVNQDELFTSAVQLTCNHR